MAAKDAFIAELKFESGLTKKILERVPFNKKEWKPHEKSFILGRLATHIAEIPQWISRIVTIEEFDFAAQPFSRHVAESTDELLSIFNDKIDKAIADLETMNDDDFNKTWTLKRGEQVIRKMSKAAGLRGYGFSHFIHHRGQLSVYLRLLEVPVPGMYGPSADEK